MPAKAGIQPCDLGDWIPAYARMTGSPAHSQAVMPAKAGIQRAGLGDWIPACAGMTMLYPGPTEKGAPCASFVPPASF